MQNKQGVEMAKDNYRMLIKHVYLYDMDSNEYLLRDIRIQNGNIQAIACKLNEEDSEPWIDLSGYFAYPAFVESHCHLAGIGRQLIVPHLDQIVCIDQLADLFQKESSEIINLRGWLPFQQPFQLSKTLLDSLEPNRPVLIVGKCGHIGYVNSKAISYFSLKSHHGIDGTDLDQGLIRERVLDEARAKICYTKEQLSDQFQRASNHLKRYGITSAHSDDWGPSTSKHLLAALDQQKELRIYEHINLSPPFSIETFIKHRHHENMSRNSSFLSIKSFKFMLDGSLGGRSAFLHQPYADKADEYGVLYYDQEQLTSLLDQSDQIGWTSAFHVIGDAALEVFLNSFAVNHPSNNPLRHRLIHVQLANEPQLDLIKKHHLHLSIQAIFYEKDVEMAQQRLGKNRFENIGYPFKKMVDGNLLLSLSTDAPIESVNPFANLAAAERFMSRKKAFHLYTTCGAFSSFQETQLGNVKPGYFADLFFLKEDLFSISSTRLPYILPELVLFNGSWFDLSRQKD